MNQILAQALKLPAAERRELAYNLLYSIDASEEDVFLTSEQEAELARRLEDCEKNSGGNFTWEEINSEALAR